LTIALLIWSRLLLVTDWPRTAVCARYTEVSVA